jgi:hypothetical protein
MSTSRKRPTAEDVKRQIFALTSEEREKLAEWLMADFRRKVDSMVAAHQETLRLQERLERAEAELERAEVELEQGHRDLEEELEQALNRAHAALKKRQRPRSPKVARETEQMAAMYDLRIKWPVIAAKFDVTVDAAKKRVERHKKQHKPGPSAG